MVQPQRVDSFGLSSVLVSDQGLRGPPGVGNGPVLEARWLESAMGPPSRGPGPVIHGAVPRPPPAAPTPATGPLLLPVLSEISPGASAGHGAHAWNASPLHIQKKE